MKPPSFEYHAPTSLQEALALKSANGAEASFLAGGQSLMPLLNMRLARPGVLIDVNRLAELDYVRELDDGIAVGAITRQRTLEWSEIARQVCPLLREALASVAHAIIRNRGTIGGSIAHADPAAELPAVLSALGGTVTVAGPNGTRVIPAEEFFLFHFTTAIEPDEILTQIWFPKIPPDAGYAFLEISRRHGDFALAGVAALVSGKQSRLAFLGVGPRPILAEATDIEDTLASTELTSDIHGSAGYRLELCRVLARRALGLAESRQKAQK